MYFVILWHLVPIAADPEQCHTICKTTLLREKSCCTTHDLIYSTRRKWIACSNACRFPFDSLLPRLVAKTTTLNPVHSFHCRARSCLHLPHLVPPHLATRSCLVANRQSNLLGRCQSLQFVVQSLVSHFQIPLCAHYFLFVSPFASNLKF